MDYYICSIQMGSSRAVLGISPTLINVNFLYFSNFSLIVMNLKLKSLGLVMVGAPLGCRE